MSQSVNHFNTVHLGLDHVTCYRPPRPWPCYLLLPTKALTVLPATAHQGLDHVTCYCPPRPWPCYLLPSTKALTVLPATAHQGLDHVTCYCPPRPWPCYLLVCAFQLSWDKTCVFCGLEIMHETLGEALVQWPKWPSQEQGLSKSTAVP